MEINSVSEASVRSHTVDSHNRKGAFKLHAEVTNRGKKDVASERS